MTTTHDEETLRTEITRLEKTLSASRARLHSLTSTIPPPSPLPSHLLILLSDSALPLGSFAFSSGLESHLAHHPISKPPASTTTTFPHFLTLSLTSLATTTLPFLLAAHRDPTQLQSLDQTLDACTLCPVARRASVAQGRALLTLWERALRNEATNSTARGALEAFSREMKTHSTTHEANGEDSEEDDSLSGHFPPIWGALTSALSIPLPSSAYTFLLNHVKAVVSAAVRASVMGPYAAQGLLASGWLQEEIERVMREGWEVGVEEAGQGVPMCDLWVGRHELLYSRIFNS